MPDFDLAIRGGTVATAADVFRADVGVRDGRLVGAVFVGDIAEQASCKALIRSGEPVGDVDDLMFGRPAPQSLAA